MQRGDGQAATAWHIASARCPKSMVHGPCAGVADDGACEVPGFGACTFTGVDPDGWPYAAVEPRAAAAPQRVPIVVADLPAAALSAASIAEVAQELAGSVHAALLGDNGTARVQFPPSYRVRLLADAGLAAWAGLNCRDRNRTALAGEIAACLDAGAVGLHCVTGDHTTLGNAAAEPVFDLDAVGLVALAREAVGVREVACSVAHAPSAMPRAIRLPRLLAKVAAGADTVFVDHCGGPAEVAASVAALRATGFGGRVLACVPVAVDLASAQVLLSFAAARVPTGYLETVLDADDPYTAGVTVATELARQMLAIPGVDGVNLSGGPAPGGERTLATALAAIARAALADAPRPLAAAP